MAGRAKSSRKIRIITVDERPLVREGLKSTLARSERAVVVGEASDGDTAIAEARRLSPDVIVHGTGEPRRAVETVESLREEVPTAKILMVGEPSKAELVLGFLRAGASGYVLSSSSTAELLRAIRAVREGQVFLSPGVARTVADRTEAAPVRRTQAKKLSPRESHVLALIAAGLTNRSIGERLGISTRTVETHRERIMRKLNIHTVAGLTRYAMEHGFTEEP